MLIQTNRQKLDLHFLGLTLRIVRSFLVFIRLFACSQFEVFLRYIEEEMKKFSEQQAKHRDAVPLIPQMSVMPPQQMHPTRFAPASGAGYNLISAHPMIASGRAMNVSFQTIILNLPDLL